MYTVDLHTHTRFFHGNDGEPTWFDPIGARLLTSIARWRGLDGLALTNHDYFRPYASGHPIVSLPGVEVSSTHGHILVIGPDPPTDTTPGELTPNQVVDIAHERGCAAILAHPHRNSSVSETGTTLDAVELNGKHPQHRPKVERLAERLNLPIVAGSDAHYPFEVGRAYTEIDVTDLTPEAVVDAIREGRINACLDDRLSNRLIQAWYRRIHTWKGHV